MSKEETLRKAKLRLETIKGHLKACEENPEKYHLTKEFLLDLKVKTEKHINTLEKC